MQDYKLIDHFVGMLAANLLYKEGITTANVGEFTDEEIVQLLQNPDKSRFWQTGGFRVLTWESFLALSKDILHGKVGEASNREINAVGSIVISYMALEECANSFVQNCLLARAVEDRQILRMLRNTKLTDKLDSYLLDVTGHSLRIDRSDLWQTFEQAQEIRHEKVHNKLLPVIFAEEEGGAYRKQDVVKIATEFLEAVPKIYEFLESIYPEDFLILDQQLKELWRIVKPRIGFDPEKLIRNIGYTQSDEGR